MEGGQGDLIKEAGGVMRAGSRKVLNSGKGREDATGLRNNLQ